MIPKYLFCSATNFQPSKTYFNNNETNNQQKSFKAEIPRLLLVECDWLKKWNEWFESDLGYKQISYWQIMNSICNHKKIVESSFRIAHSIVIWRKN